MRKVTKFFSFHVTELAEFVLAVSPVGLYLYEQFEEYTFAEEGFDVFAGLGAYAF